MDAVAALGQLLTDEKERIARLWSKRLGAELHESELWDREAREPLLHRLEELARLISERGEEGIRLWPEYIRGHGAARFGRRFDAEDVVRELKLLHEVLLSTYQKRHGTVEPELAHLLAELIGEATAGVLASYVRAIRTEEVRFRDAGVMESVLQHLDVGILLADANGSVTYVTPAAAKLFGVPVRMLLGIHGLESMRAVLRDVKARHPDGERFRWSEMPLTRALQERQAVRGVWMVIDRPSDGREVHVEISATPLWPDSGDGQPFGVLQTMTDRTETARKTEQLTQAYAELQKLQGRLLQRTRRQALGQLASGAAHALNNFLNVLRLRITLLRREFKPEHLDALDRTVKNIGGLVSRLQEFSVHRAEEDLKDADVRQVLKEALELVGPELAQPEAPISLDTNLDQTAKAKVDATMLRELVVSLVLVAKERMPKGGHLTITLKAESGWISLCVEDTGSPYTPEEFAQLFDPLRGQTHAPQLALLLAVGRNQVQRWGGELWSENRSGETAGAVFTVRLPISEQKPAPAPAPAPRPAAPAVATGGGGGGRRRVLVVDDDPDNAHMLADVLRDEGYEVTTAASGEVAKQLWERQHFDAALLDALMPDISGWELAREIRQRSPEALIAMVTGADVRGQNRANLALVDAVFRKPIDVNALDDFLSQAERRGASEELTVH